MGQEEGRWGWQGAEDWYLESYCSEQPLCKTSCCWVPEHLFPVFKLPVKESLLLSPFYRWKN